MNTESFLNMDQAAEFLGLAKGTLYKMNMRGVVPSYRPNGGRVLFKKDELQAWIEGHRRASRQELETQALNSGKGARK